MLSVGRNTVNNADSGTLIENLATNMNKDNIPIYKIWLASHLFVRNIVPSDLDTIQASFDLRQDFLSDKMTPFAPFCKSERLLPGHGHSMVSKIQIAWEYKRYDKPEKEIVY